MHQANTYIGTPQNRVDGRAKVTGAAKYAAEFDAPDLAYGIVVSSAIARGQVKSIDASAALALVTELVLALISWLVAPGRKQAALPWTRRGAAGPAGSAAASERTLVDTPL